MGDFTDRVMGAIGGNGSDDGSDGGEDGDETTNPTSPFAGTNQGGQHVAPETGPEEITPVGPGKDDLGYELVPFTCRRCSVTDHATQLMLDIHKRHGMLCLPCVVPWRFKWKRDPDTDEIFLFPTPGGGKPRSRLGEPERRALASVGTELIDKKLRRDLLRTTILRMQEELSIIEPRIFELQEKELPEAQTALESIETDPKLETRQRAADIVHDLNLLLAKMAKDSKLNIAKERATKSVTR